MRSRFASALGSRNQIAAVLLVVAGAFGLTSLPPTARADQATEQARKHYQLGKQYFDLGKWDAAIAEFEEAYSLHADANLLFNLATAYRRKGDPQHALDLYKNYLIANPKSPRRSAIEARIEMLEKDVQQRPAAAPVAGPSETVPAPVLAKPPAPENPAGDLPSWPSMSAAWRCAPARPRGTPRC